MSLRRSLPRRELTKELPFAEQFGTPRVSIETTLVE